MESVQQNAIGVAIIATVKEDGVVVNIAAVSTKQLVFKKPNGITITKTASFVTDGTDGQLQYITEADFLDASGLWRVQGYVLFPAGFNGRSDITTFQVRDNL